MSLAALRWQKELIGALKDIGIRIVVASFVPEPAWPRGPFAVETAGALGGAEELAIKYLNIPGARELSLAAGAQGALTEGLRGKEAPGALITYNARWAFAALGQWAQGRWGCPWIPIIADVPDTPGRLAAHDRAISQALGRVYLSWRQYECAPGPKLHLDGGVCPAQLAPKKGQSRALLYAGALSQYAGVECLLNAFRLVDDPSAELWICGKGDRRPVERAALADRRIRFFGTVSDERLEELCGAARAFVNPRPAALPASEANFPSKLLAYLGHGKPIVSTWTPGLAPAYREVLVVAEPDTPEQVAAKMREVLAWDDRRLAEERERVAGFVEAGHGWEQNAERLARFVAARTTKRE